jgi:hypothetical protein
MEIVIIAIVVVAIGAIIYFNRGSKSLDINQDGKIDAADATAAVQNVIEGVKASADVNQDGKVDTADVKVVVETAKAQIKKTVSKAKTATKKSGRKPK